MTKLEEAEDVRIRAENLLTGTEINGHVLVFGDNLEFLEFRFTVDKRKNVPTVTAWPTDVIGASFRSLWPQICAEAIRIATEREAEAREEALKEARALLARFGEKTEQRSK